MGADELIQIVSDLCLKFLPILGVVLLVYLIILLRRILNLLQNVNHTVDTVNKTVEEVNMQIRKLDAPLNTVAAISLSVDHLHELGQKAVSNTAQMILENIEFLKSWIMSILHLQNDENDIVKKESIDPVQSQEITPTQEEKGNE